MDNHHCGTYGEQFTAALACTTPAEAEAWIEKEVEHYVQFHGKSVAEAVQIIKSNIGYMAGYYDHETAQKIHRLFHAVHPIFGTADYHETVSPKEAFDLGRKLGERGNAQS